MDKRASGLSYPTSGSGLKLTCLERLLLAQSGDWAVDPCQLSAISGLKQRSKGRSFDHLVGEQLHRVRHLDAEGLRGLHVNRGPASMLRTPLQYLAGLTDEGGPPS